MIHRLIPTSEILAYKVAIVNPNPQEPGIDSYLFVSLSDFADILLDVHFDFGRVWAAQNDKKFPDKHPQIRRIVTYGSPFYSGFGWAPEVLEFAGDRSTADLSGLVLPGWHVAPEAFLPMSFFAGPGGLVTARFFAKNDISSATQQIVATGFSSAFLDAYHVYLEEARMSEMVSDVTVEVAAIVGLNFKSLVVKNDRGFFVGLARDLYSGSAPDVTIGKLGDGFMIPDGNVYGPKTNAAWPPGDSSSPDALTQTVSALIYAPLGVLYLFKDGAAASVVRLPFAEDRPTDCRLQFGGGYIETGFGLFDPVILPFFSNETTLETVPAPPDFTILTTLTTEGWGAGQEITAPASGLMRGITQTKNKGHHATREFIFP